MPGKLRSRRPSHATVVAYLALFVALGGTGAFAAHETIFSDDIVDGQVMNPDLGNDSVSTTKIQTQGVTTGDLAANSVTSTRIPAEAVGTSEIQQASVFNADLAANSITDTRLANNSVGSSEIQDDAVTLPKLAPWLVESEVNDSRGPLPIERVFQSPGGDALIMASGSAFRLNTGGMMRVAVRVDGTLEDEMTAYTNETSSHKTLVDAYHSEILDPGQHTIRLEAVTDFECNTAAETPDDFCTTTDDNDWFEVSIVQFP